VTAWKVRLSNTGKTPLLIAPPRINRGGGSIRGLVPQRYVPGFTVRGGGFAFAGGGRTYTLENARVLAAGESIDLPVQSRRLNQTGRWFLHFDVQVTSRVRLGECQLRFGAAPRRTKHGNRKTESVRAKGSVPVYPDWTRDRERRGVTLTVVPKTATVEAGAYFEAEVRMENRGDKAVRIDANWQRYCWVAFAHAEGKALVPSTAFGLSVPKIPAVKDPDAFVPRDLAAGERATQTIALTVPETPGTYRLAAGYDLPPQRDRTTGTLIARAVDVAVSAPD
jgi:hypothetical protein